MPSVERQITAAVIATLDDPGKPAGLMVHGDEAKPLEPSQVPAAVVYPNTEAIDRSDHQSLQRMLRLFVEIRVISTDASGIDDALDAVYVWVSSRMQIDRSLGGLSMDIVETTRGWDRENADQGHGLMLVQFDITYITSRTDPTTK